MRIVVKVGTSTLTYPTGRLNIRRTEELVKVLSDLKNAGHQVILVSSGAIGMGVGKLSLPQRPADMAGKQACAAVGQRLDELAGPGRPAARHAAGRVDQVFGDGVDPAGPGHQAAEVGLLLGGGVKGAVGDHPLAAGGRDVGVDADDGVGPAGHLLNLRHGQPGRHGAEDEPLALRRTPGKDRLQRGQHPGHHLGLDAQKDQVAAGGVLVGTGAAAQFGGQRLGFGRGAVCQNHVRRRSHPADCPGHRAAHVAAANKAYRFHFPFLLDKL